MRLTLHESMTAGTSGAGPEKGPADGRAFRRFAVSLPVLVQAQDAGPARRARTATALVTDISLSGLVFLSPRAYAPGALIEVQIALAGHTHLVGAVVRRGQCVFLPGRRAWQCAAQLLRGDEAVRFIPRLARYLHARAAKD